MKSRRFSSDRQLLDVEANKIVLKNGGKGTGVGNVQAFLHLVGNRLPKSIKQGQPDGIFGPGDRIVRQEVPGSNGPEGRRHRRPSHPCGHGPGARRQARPRYRVTRRLCRRRPGGIGPTGRRPPGLLRLSWHEDPYGQRADHRALQREAHDGGVSIGKVIHVAARNIGRRRADPGALQLRAERCRRRQDGRLGAGRAVRRRRSQALRSRVHAVRDAQPVPARLRRRPEWLDDARLRIAYPQSRVPRHADRRVSRSQARPVHEREAAPRERNARRSLRAASDGRSLVPEAIARRRHPRWLLRGVAVLAAARCACSRRRAAACCRSRSSAHP